MRSVSRFAVAASLAAVLFCRPLILPSQGPAAQRSQITVTPDTATTLQRPVNGRGFLAVFKVKNTGDHRETYVILCAGAHNVQCTAVSDASVTLQPGDSVLVTATYATGRRGTGRLRLRAQRADGGAGDAGAYRVPVGGGPPPLGPPPPFAVSVSPDNATAATRTAGTTGHAETFYVWNIGEAPDLYTIACSGLTNVTCTGVSTSQLSLDGGALASVQAFYNVGAAGTGRLTLTATGEASDAGYFNVPVTGVPSAPVISLVNHNGDNRDRSLCLTVGAGEAAAVQCGDLLVSHGLPGYRTMGRERALTLVYGSAQAVPRPVIAVKVDQTGKAVPQSVFVRLSLNGVARDSATFNPWSSGTLARQVAIAHVGDTDSSGLYPFTLLVRNQYSGATHDATISDTLIVVNRAQSPFGSGWWLAGVEELRLNQPGNKILWIGGDGSAKVYRNVAANTWVAAAGAYRDTLRYDAGTSTYTRTLRHGIAVSFDANGRHIRTRNRVGQVTTFTWAGSPVRLTTIKVAPDTSVVYTLTYDGANALDYLTDPAGRVLNATVTSGKLVHLVDPDTTAVHTAFAYDATAPGRMISRTTRRGNTTTFTYANGLRVTKVSIPVGRQAGDTATAVTQFTMWDERGLAIGGGTQTAVDTATVYTKIDGPRLDVADTAEFWVDRWGAPTRMRDPFGALTTVVRGDATGLVTRLTRADGSIALMTWNARGNLLQVRDSTWHLADSIRQATTVRRWTYLTDTIRQDSPDSVADSTETGILLTRFAYNALGLTDSVIAPNGHVTRFFVRTGGIDPLRGLVDSVIERRVPTWDTTTKTEPVRDLKTSFTYNALGNVLRTVSPSGRVDSLTRDAAQRVSNVYDGAGHRTRFEYDPLNRTRKSVQYLEGPDSAITMQQFAIDVLTSITDPRGVARTYGYDFANRRITETDDYGKIEATFYNRAGLVDSVKPRFFQDSVGRAIRHNYDAAGRLTRTRWPARELVPGDSILFTYDLLGRQLTAIQSNRRIVRTFYATGALRNEIQESNPPGSGKFTLFYAYDRVGRRAWYRSGNPTNPVQSDSVWYRYIAGSGDLRTIGVRWRGTGTPIDSVRFYWDSLGRRDSVVYRNGTVVRFSYHPDGLAQLICASHPGGPASGEPDVFDFTQYHRVVDMEGLIRQTVRGSTGLTGCGQNVGHTSGSSVAYDSRHQIVAQNIAGDSSEFEYDRSGNRTVHRRHIGSALEDWRNIMDSLHNRLRMSYNAAVAGGIADSTRYVYDANGGRLVEQPFADGTPISTEPYRQFWYDALGRTTGTAEWECIPGSGNASSGAEGGPVGGCVWGDFNNRPTACEYDPAGRLFDVCEAGQPNLGYDGQNAVRTGNDTNTGEWSFVHGPGLDDPVMGYYQIIGGGVRKVYFVTDGRGGNLAVGDTTGLAATSHNEYTSGGGRLAGGAWYAESFYSNRHMNPEMRQLSFYRNRFYDQETGRWTQEDPVGVGGGLNLYQFNRNNPAMFTDPFGSCPDVRVDGKNIQIDANLQISGATAADATAVRSGITRAWSGKHGGYNITVNLTKPDAPVVSVTITGRGPTGGQLVGEGGSINVSSGIVPSGHGLGGVIRMPVGNADETGRLAAHEFGHVLGVDHSAFKNDLMAEPAGYFVSRNDVALMVANCKLQDEPETKPDSGKSGASK